MERQTSTDALAGRAGSGAAEITNGQVVGGVGGVVGHPARLPQGQPHGHLSRNPTPVAPQEPARSISDQAYGATSSAAPGARGATAHKQAPDELDPVSKFIARHGGLVAMVAAAALTAKGEWDLAVLVHYPKMIAWLLPVALDVYLATAAARRARADIVIGLLLMMGCQVAVHLVPVWIDFEAGEQVPWGLVVAAVCVPPIIALRAVHGMHGSKKAAREAEELAARELAAAEQVRQAQARTAAVQAQLRQEQAAREADARTAAEQMREQQEAADTRLRDEQAAREAAEQAARDAKAKADRATLRADRARTDSERDAAARRSQAQRVTPPVTPPVTQHGGQADAPETPSVTHTDDASPRPGDASGGGPNQAGDASLTYDERMTLAVMEAVEGKASARAAALSHNVDPQAVQRRVRTARREAGTQEPRPLARPAADGAEPTQHSTT